MPNWCSNRLAVRGPAPDVERWSREVAGTDSGGNPVPLDFERVLPTPPEFVAGNAPSAQAVELVRLYLSADVEDRQRLARAQPLVAQMAMDAAMGKRLEEVALWDAGDWRTHNWGTKWTAAAESFRSDDAVDSPGNVILMFSTAWSPPRPLVMELIQRYSNLSFELAYSEPDDGFAGRLVGECGEVVLDTETREPEEAVALLAAAGWDDAAADWSEARD